MTPIFIRFTKRLYKSLWNQKNFEIVNARFFKVLPITFYIELSSKYVGVVVNFALLRESYSGDPHFLFFFSKRLYKSLWNKNKTLRLLMPDILIVHSIAFELSSKYVGVRVNFGLLKEN